MKQTFLYDARTGEKFSATAGDYFLTAPSTVLRHQRRNLWLVETETNGLEVTANIIKRRVTIGDLLNHERAPRCNC